MGKKKTPTPNPTDVYNRATNAYNQTQTPSHSEQALQQVSPEFMNNYRAGAAQNMQDYGDIMGGYRGLKIGGPTKFSFQNVKANRPAELTEGYGYMREAAPGYREFAQTGGYSPQDIQELRARSTNPVRAAYGNSMMEMNRARAIGGAGGSPNYIAALSKGTRDLSQGVSDAQTNINAALADQIRQGKLSGLAGLTGIGQTMGGLSSDEANRMLQASLANQGADIQTQQLGEQSRQFGIGAELNRLGGQAGLYGTTPGMASTFGNQALDAWRTLNSAEGQRNQYGLGLLDAQLRAAQMQQQKTPWWQTALGIAGTVAPYAAML